jgi:uncharacterized protein
MPDDLLPSFTAFAGPRRIDSGALAAVAASVKRAIDAGEAGEILIFDDSNARTVEIDFRGSLDDVRDSVARAFVAMDGSAGLPHEEPRRGPGRPRLGVVAREVTLLPRHWEWLAQQAGGASVAIRKLVEEARRGGDDKDRIRRAQEAAYRFMSAMAGNKPHFEEATRALFAPDPVRFKVLIAGWPVDVRDHAAKLAERAFQRQPQAI